MKFDFKKQKNVLKHYLLNGVSLLKNKEFYDFDEEFYFKSLGKKISNDLPFIFCWFCHRTQSLVLEIDNFSDYCRVKVIDGNLNLIKGSDFENHSKVFLLAILKITLEYEGHIKALEKGVDKDNVSSSSDDEESDDDFEWL